LKADVEPFSPHRPFAFSGYVAKVWPDTLTRLSVGLEDPDNLIIDLVRALG